MEDQEGETATEVEQNGLKEDELELSLGLRPATIRCHFNASNTKIPVPEGSGDLSLMTVPIWGKGGAGSEQDSEGLGFEVEAKKEAQALRRQEARKKREEKRKSKANAVSGNSNDRMLWFEKQRAAGRERSERETEDDFSERRRKGERNCNINEVEAVVPAPATTSFLVRPSRCVNGSNQLNGLSYYMMMPGLVGSDGNGVQRTVGAGAGGFQPYQVTEKNSGNVKQSVSGCSRGSSPGVSDYRSTSGQGGSSSDGGSHSSHSHPLEPTTTTNGTTKPQTTTHDSQSSAPQPKAECTTTSSCYRREPNPATQTETSPGKKPMPSTTHRSRSPCKETKGVNPSKPPKPPAQHSNDAMLLSQMPYVSTTGNGPDGKTITGFLYKYTNSEVCIVCVCHGSSFTPAGFVQHAGGIDVDNPLRHITVVPFTFT